jgi:thioredoxin 1
MLIDFADEDFEKKVKNEDVSILQFSASWCGPCKVLKPIMDKLSDEFKDNAKFYYADIDERAINSASAAAVRGVPTIIVYKKGVEVARKVGGLPEQQMRDFLKENI